MKKTLQSQKAKSKKSTTARCALSQVKNAHRAVSVSLGDLVAAAFDAVGNEVDKAAAVLESRAMTRATHRRIVFI